MDKGDGKKKNNLKHVTRSLILAECSQLAEFVAYHGFPQYSDMIVAAQSSPFDDNAEADIKKHWPFVKKLGHRKKIMKHFSSLTDQCRQAVYAKGIGSLFG